MTETRKCLNRDVIKYIAIAAMFLNHVASIFITANPYLRRIFLGVGNFTAITMCYFLVEGYRYTRSKGKYMLRLLLFALVSQLPYSFAFSKPGTLQLVYFNMLFTLLLCFLICLVMDKVEHPLWKTLLVMGITACSVKCDWAFGAPVFTLLFIWSRDSDSKKKIAFAIPTVLYCIYTFIACYGNMSTGICILYTAVSTLSMAMSGICITCFYNGKRAEKGRNFSKWFFYIFYPAHLLVFALIRHLS